MKRKLICVLLTLCLCAGLVPMTAAGADPYPTGTVVIPLTEAGVPDGDGGALWSYDAAGETLTLNAGHSFAVDGVCPVRVICKGSIVGGTYTGDVEVYNGGSVSGGLFSGRLLEKLGAKIEDAEFPVTFELNGGVYQYAAGTVIPRNSWIPFSSFGGTFEGGGHKIENLYVQTIDRNAGLFDNSYGTIRDVEIASGSVAIRKLTHAGFYAGGIAARSSGTIERCVNRADISANDDNQVASSGSNALNLGGIAGFLGTSLLGAAVSAVTDCVNFGAVRNLGDSNVCEVSVGGIAGYQHSGMISGKASLISGCVNRGSVSAPNPIYSVWAGGIVGTAAGNSAAVTATAASCENRGSVSSGFAAGGIAGYSKA